MRKAGIAPTPNINHLCGNIAGDLEIQLLKRAYINYQLEVIRKQRGV